ncbi:MAG: hypothetical protein O3A95_03195 [Planctomycetota bacterium]|nr:hypothetical protein [Planctomycetota bacterium]MDA1113287.1 hypothetical protein [Planctomycetota bacterium]
MDAKRRFIDQQPEAAQVFNCAAGQKVRVGVHGRLETANPV